MAASNTIRAKPVNLLTSVAAAIPHDRDTTAESDNSARGADRLGTGSVGSGPGLPVLLTVIAGNGLGPAPGCAGGLMAVADFVIAVGQCHLDRI